MPIPPLRYARIEATVIRTLRTQGFPKHFSTRTPLRSNWWFLMSMEQTRWIVALQVRAHLREDVEKIVGPDWFAYRLVSHDPQQTALCVGRLPIQPQERVAP